MRDKRVAKILTRGRTCTADSLSSPWDSRHPREYLYLASRPSICFYRPFVAFFLPRRLYIIVIPRRAKMCHGIWRDVHARCEGTVTYATGWACKIYLLGPNILRASVCTPSPILEFYLSMFPGYERGNLGELFHDVSYHAFFFAVGTPTFITRDKRRPSSLVKREEYTRSKLDISAQCYTWNIRRSFV